MTRRKKDNTIKLHKFQKKLQICGLLMIVGLWALSFFAGNMLSSINVEVERLTKEVKKQEKINQGLAMKINELASLENIQSVANSEGLAYNNSNIIIIKNEQ